MVKYLIKDTTREEREQIVQNLWEILMLPVMDAVPGS